MMETTNNLNDLKVVKNKSIALTIGTFDGVHQGHKAILNKMISYGIPYVVTFTNHPQQILSNHAPLSITSPTHKLFLLEKCNVARCYELPFNKEFAKQNAKEFLQKLKKATNFSYLILGHDAKIGFQREGNKELLLQLAKELDFHLEYIPPYTINNQIISSTLIRNKIQNDQLEELPSLLGRKYSLLSVVIQGERRGRLMGYPTANLDVSGLALPSLGVWTCDLIPLCENKPTFGQRESSRDGAIDEGGYTAEYILPHRSRQPEALTRPNVGLFSQSGIKHNQKIYPGVANLGFAPTLNTDRRCLLEVHLLEGSPHLYGEIVEVIFKKHLRKEHCFSTKEELKKQIALDIKHAQKGLLTNE